MNISNWWSELALISSETVYFDDMANFNWNLFEDPPYVPILHQKRIKGLKYDNVRPSKGIGFVRMFKGFRYPVGRKNL